MKKTLLTSILAAIVIITVSSCGKTGSCGCRPLAESVNFELVGKDGKSLVTSLSDSVKIRYTENGVVKFHNLSVQKLPVSNADSTPVKYYNGLVINDEKFMSQLSGRTDNPVRNFTISLNGTTLGDIYLDYWKFYAEFNNKQVNSDRNFEYFNRGSNIFFLQM